MSVSDSNTTRKEQQTKEGMDVGKEGIFSTAPFEVPTILSDYFKQSVVQVSTQKSVISC